MTDVALRIDGERLNRDLADLARIGAVSDRSDGVPGGISRTAFSPADVRARAWYVARCEDAGLTLRYDGLGNMIASVPGAPEGAPVWSGSHLDTVPQGGAYDGALGSLAALECVRRIAECGVQLARPVEAVVFSDEEGNYAHLLGSMGLLHGYRKDQLDSFTGRDGDRLMDALGAFPYRTGAPTETKLARGAVHRFVELHIEQGPRLEQEDVDIGVVTSIVGLSGGYVDFVGRADHAGTTPMTMRKDALRAAAEFILALPPIAAATGSSSVITTGRITVEPGGSNVVPRFASVSVDYRDPGAGRVAEIGRRIVEAAERAAAQHDVAVVWHPEDVVPPTPLDGSVRSVIAAAADDLGLRRMDIPSGAGHDSQNMAHLAPTAMIFVPSRDGRSHTPYEYTAPEHVERGANVLLTTLLRLASA